MRFEQGATVLTADEEKIGTLTSVIVDPDSRDVTELVVSEGVMLPQDSIVPVDAVEQTPTADDVVLKPGIDPTRFETFDSRRYVKDLGRLHETFGAGPGYVLAPTPGVPPMVYAQTTPEAPSPDPATTLTTTIQAGTPVVTLDGHRIGKVEEVHTLDDGSIDGIMTKSGMLFWARRRFIPAGWLRDITSVEIRLSVDKERFDAENRSPKQSIAQRPSGR